MGSTFRHQNLLEINTYGGFGSLVAMKIADAAAATIPCVVAAVRDMLDD